MSTEPTAPDEYIASLPEDRREAVSAIRDVINANLGEGFEEGMQYGMPAWFVPHSVFPDGYHCDPKQPLPFASVASQKKHIGIYLFCIYMDENEKERFVTAWEKTGKKLDMGKSCIRVKNLEGVALKVVGASIRRMTSKKHIAQYEKVRPASSKRKPAVKAAAKKTVAKRAR